MTRFTHITIVPWLILLCYLCHVTFGQGNMSTIKCFDEERKALLQFKDGITVDVCGLLTSWRDDNDCCQWNGVRCNNYTGHVVTLRLHGSEYSSCLEGNLSSSLGKLTYLRHLNLNFNDLSQPNLEFLGSLTNLEYLSLGDAFSNSYPGEGLHWLSNLSLLRHLNMSSINLREATNWTKIVGKLPFLSVLRMDHSSLPTNISSSISHINSSSNLRVISLSKNDFNNTSIFRWLFSLTGLVYLNLSNNMFEDPIPNGFESLKLLSHLDLSYNHFEGPIPKGFGNLQHLSYLDLSVNQLNGPIPRVFWNMHSLSYLSLAENNLQGSVSDIFIGLCNLKQLYLGANNITDELADVIRALVTCGNTTLRVLDLRQNRFWSIIPDTIDSISLLTELYLHDNQLNGPITPAIGQLGMLEVLDISSNLLEATLNHTHFSNLSRLRELYLSDNPRIEINVDTSWDPPFQLDIIDLRSCKLGPHFPSWLQKQTNFSYLDVSQNEISYGIPASFWKILPSKSMYLNMSQNQIPGMIPNVINEVGCMSEVDLSSNLFEGAIPPVFARASYLFLNNNRFSDCYHFLCSETLSPSMKIDLSNNFLSGELPDCFMKFDWLIILHLENNRFSGSIPKSIGTLNDLEHLHMQNNSFSGSIPTSLMNCTSLAFLNFGDNSMIGNIPPLVFSNTQRLVGLILRNNSFVGEIPASLCQLPHLQILDLAINNLSGRIPSCVSNFTAMLNNEVGYGMSSGAGGTSFGLEAIITEVETLTVAWKREEQKFKESIVFVKSIDLSFNKLSGEIPDELFDLIGLQSLALSKNNFTGSISIKAGNLTSLQLLDLSNNHLSGQIPASLASISSLAILDLSNNYLSGKIPLGTQLQSFTASSYLGNSGLCGDPLPKCPGEQAGNSVMNGDNNSGEDERKDYTFFLGMYIAAVLGFITGFWVVFGSLVIKRRWRHAWFRFLDNIRDRIYVMSMGIIAKVWR